MWFQNRRTKHKRMQQEDGSEAKSGGDGQQSPKHYDDEDELIDMDDCGSDDE